MSTLSAAEAHILDLVKAIQPFDALEQEHITDVLAWINSGAPVV